jgi:hypothetical protein
LDPLGVSPSRVKLKAGGIEMATKERWRRRAQRYTGLAYEDMKVAFEREIKVVLIKQFEEGNKVLDENGGDPAEYGIPNELDIAQILRKAAKAMKECAGDYLYHHTPLTEGVIKYHQSLNNGWRK